MEKIFSCQDNEFVCHTCVCNVDLTNVIQFEQDNPQTVFIPMQLRRTNKVGIVFTKSSYLYEYHLNHYKNHDWGKYI